jgi:hypothetical protein
MRKSHRRRKIKRKRMKRKRESDSFLGREGASRKEIVSRRRLVTKLRASRSESAYCERLLASDKDQGESLRDCLLKEVNGNDKALGKMLEQ